MSAEHERILIGSNRIRAYIGDQLHWELVPHGFSMLQTDITGTLPVSNPVSGSPTISYKLWRLGSLRILAIATYNTVVLESTPAVVATTTALAAGDRPAAAIYEDIIVVNNATTAAGLAVLGTNGILTMSSGYTGTGITYSTSAGAGFKSFLMMYDTAAHHNGF